MEETDLLSYLARVLDVAFQECGLDSTQLSIMDVAGSTILSVVSDGVEASVYVDTGKNVSTCVHHKNLHKRCSLEELIDTIMDIK